MDEKGESVEFLERAEKEWAEILELNREIADVGFKKQEFTYFSRPKDDRGFFIKDAEPTEKSIILNTKMRVYDKIDGEVKELRPEPFRRKISDDPNAILELSEALNAFFSGYATLLWSRRQLMKPPLKEKDLIREAKGIFLDEERRFLKERNYTSEDIQNLMQKVKQTRLLQRKLREYTGSDQYQGFASIKQGSDECVELDRNIMSQISSLYRGDNPPLFEKPISDRKIHSNMAIVFAKVDFWTDHKRKKPKERIWTYYERIKKRLYEFDKKPKRTNLNNSQLFDPS